MRNLDLYGIEKVNKELNKRALVLDRLSSDGVKTARIMAWNSFINDLIQMDSSNERCWRIAQIRYDEAVEIFNERGLSMDTDFSEFERNFADELNVINKKVTNKGVQLTFYIFVALGLFGLYKLFFH